ncbi:hypothetical protein B0I35DRAFT_414633 [Stachybotrys elegans]|uniref:Uncharacterized protein n=1 Tax=Stachybotrys elegans TaxID=80388 RepID=A0A8K0SCW8_9HYPO|nr:hypothetical protein B0I35DRAFT_414633 [Stachybotrys elegans]
MLAQLCGKERKSQHVLGLAINTLKNGNAFTFVLDALFLSPQQAQPLNKRADCRTEIVYGGDLAQRCGICGTMTMGTASSLAKAPQRNSEAGPPCPARQRRRGLPFDVWPQRSRVTNRSVYETEHWNHDDGIEMTRQSHILGRGSDEHLDEPMPGIQRRMEIEVRVETDAKAQDAFRSRWDGDSQRQVEDEIPLTKNTGHLKDVVVVEESRRSSSGSN